MSVYFLMLSKLSTEYKNFHVFIILKMHYKLNLSYKRNLFFKIFFFFLPQLNNPAPAGFSEIYDYCCRRRRRPKYIYRYFGGPLYSSVFIGVHDVPTRARISKIMVNIGLPVRALK